MSSDSTPLGDRMKGYEAVTRGVLPRRTYTVLRVDGRAFHTLLRGAKKPYDTDFMLAMGDVAEALCAEITGSVFAYTQSDEVSVLCTDFNTLNTQPWFGGVLAKQISIAASTATVAFNSSTSWAGKWAQFDARVFTVPDPVEVANYFLWRQQDATRNSIAMTAQAYFSHKELHGVNTDQMQELLWSEHKVNWNDMPDGFKRGRVTYRKSEEGLAGTLPYLVPSSVVSTEAAPRFVAAPDNWLAGMIPEQPSLTH